MGSGVSRRKPGPKPAKHPGGRPSKYEARFTGLAYQFALLGASQAKLAEALDVSLFTVEEWLRTKPKFSREWRRGKDQADAAVTKSLFQRAIGYSHPAVKIFIHEGEVIKVPYVERYAPETAAATFILTNRQRELWKTRQSTEHTGADGGPIQHAQVKIVMLDNGRGGS